MVMVSRRVDERGRTVIVIRTDEGEVLGELTLHRPGGEALAIGFCAEWGDAVTEQQQPMIAPAPPSPAKRTLRLLPHSARQR